MPFLRRQVFIIHVNICYFHFVLLAEEERMSQPGLTESFAKAALLTRCELICSFFYFVQQKVFIYLANSFRFQKGDKVEYNWGPEYGVLIGSYVRMSKANDPG